MQELELERTYLLKELPKDLKAFPSKEMLDIYIPASAEHPHLRIRQSGDKQMITKTQLAKAGDDSEQIETTIPLEEAEYAELSLVPGKQVSKTRYAYQEDGVSYEIDVFTGELSGLVMADIEFAGIKEKDEFQMPSFCLVEVTQEQFLAGGRLCGKKYADIETDLNRLGYKKL